MGCGEAWVCDATGAELFAAVSCEKNSHQGWPFAAEGPSDLSGSLDCSCAMVRSVPYHATSMIPGPPATTHGITLMFAGAVLICFGADHEVHSLSALTGDHEYQTW